MGGIYNGNNNRSDLDFCHNCTNIIFSDTLFVKEDMWG